MFESSEPAAECWEIERQTCGHLLRPCSVVILRSKKQSGKSVIQAASSDFDSMNRYAGRLKEDLYTLTNDEFVHKYEIGQKS